MMKSAKLECCVEYSFLVGWFQGFQKIVNSITCSTTNPDVILIFSPTSAGFSLLESVILYYFNKSTKSDAQENIKSTSLKLFFHLNLQAKFDNNMDILKY